MGGSKPLADDQSGHCNHGQKMERPQVLGEENPTGIEGPGRRHATFRREPEMGEEPHRLAERHT